MSISTFDIFSIGIGPSSSHTNGPMLASALFNQLLTEKNLIKNTNKITIELYGSLALTGKGHSTDFAVIIGLENKVPETTIPELALARYNEILTKKKLCLSEENTIDFDYDKHLIFHYDKQLPHHTNGIKYCAYNKSDKNILEKEYYSVGGGFIVDKESFDGTMSSVNTVNKIDENIEDSRKNPYEFSSAAELLKLCQQYNKSIAEIVYLSELIYRSDYEIRGGLLNIWHIMHDCIDKGLKSEGILPGRIRYKRRAPQIFKKLCQINDNNNPHIDSYMNWVSLYAIAVNEENASNGRIVTAPTNGAAGVIPAVLKYYTTFKDCTNDKIIEFFLTAAAIGILYKKNASISGAEVGCQGEVGVACSMAAGALTAVLGGTPNQIENAAEIGMEHNLGMTCDPIDGLVIIPCIERNAAAAVAAINSAQLALLGDGTHYVPLDDVIKTMRDTGHDMMSKYKETSQGGLAINVSLPEC